VATEAFEHVAIDIVGPFTDKNNQKKFLLTMLDGFTRWPIAVVVDNETTRTVTDAIHKHLITKHGTPKYLASDKASGFTSAQMQAICEILGVKKKTTTGLQPQANATCERLHRFLNASLTILVNKYSTDWEKYVDTVLFSYRISANASTGFSPFFMVYGRQPRLPLDIILGSEKNLQPDIDRCGDSFVAHMADVFA
jgi:transposase InsO family protein